MTAEPDNDSFTNPPEISAMIMAGIVFIVMGIGAAVLTVLYITGVL